MTGASIASFFSSTVSVLAVSATMRLSAKSESGRSNVSGSAIESFAANAIAALDDEGNAPKADARTNIRMNDNDMSSLTFKSEFAL